MQKNELIKIAIKAAIAAGDKILYYYNQECIEVQQKQDNSPLTLADISANDAIFSYLSTMPYEICSEENILSPDKMGLNDIFWLVDPLDGTKNFLSKNDEFCVCIALIQRLRPILSVIYIPTSKELFYTDGFSVYFNDKSIKMQNQNNVICTNDHRMDKINKIAQKFNLNITRCGSAIKFCRITEGKVDVYPRFVGSSLWDIAAGDVLVKASGGGVFGIKSGNELTYNGNNLKNEYFIALSKNFIHKKDEILNYIRNFYLD